MPCFLRAMNNYYTDYLTPSGSMLVGAASAFAIGGRFFYFNESASPEAADARAIRQDFFVIASDVVKSREKFEKENQTLLCR